MIDKDESRRIRSAIRRVLLEYWDPIGIQNDAKAQTQYDRYAGGIYELLVRNASHEDVANHLRWIVEERMALHYAADATQRTVRELRAIPIPPLNVRPLFSRASLLELKQHHEQSARDMVDRLSPTMLDQDDAEIASKIMSTFTLELPVIDETLAYTLQSGDQMTIHIPFKGDFSLFEMRPSCNVSSPPLGEIDVQENEILLVYRDADATAQTIREIKQHLEWLGPDITDTRWLREKVLQQIAKAKARG